jgi:hypothetical protein
MMKAVLVDRSPVANPPRELVEFAERHVLNLKLYAGAERRSEMRHLLVVPVLAVPVDDDCEPIGSPFHIVTRELSSKGAGLVHFERIQYKKLALQLCLPNSKVNLVARVVWRKPLGPLYGTGLEFIARLKEFPQLHGPCPWETSCAPS